MLETARRRTDRALVLSTGQIVGWIYFIHLFFTFSRQMLFSFPVYRTWARVKVRVTRSHKQWQGWADGHGSRSVAGLAPEQGEVRTPLHCVVRGGRCLKTTWLPKKPDSERESAWHQHHRPWIPICSFTQFERSFQATRCESVILDFYH